MKIVVISDSHGNTRNFMKIIRTHPDAACYVHLGDGEADISELEMQRPDIMKKLAFVGGNCDLGMHERTKITELDGVRIFLAHGDNYSVKTDKTVIAAAALENNCTAAFFGHSHIRFCEEINGVFLLNPGSCDMQHDGTRPSYAVVTTENGKLRAEIFDL